MYKTLLLSQDYHPLVGFTVSTYWQTSFVIMITVFGQQQIDNKHQTNGWSTCFSYLHTQQTVTEKELSWLILTHTTVMESVLKFTTRHRLIDWAGFYVSTNTV